VGVQGLRLGLQWAKKMLRKVKEAAKGIAAGFSTKDVVEAVVLEDGGAEVHCQSVVRQDVGNCVGGEGCRGGRAGKGVLLAKAPEGICHIVTTQTEGFVAFGWVEFMGVVGIKAVTCRQLDTSRPISMVERLE